MKWIEYLAAHMTADAKSAVCKKVTGVTPMPDHYRVVVQSADSAETEVEIEVFDDTQHEKVGETYRMPVEELEAILEVDGGMNTDDLYETWDEEETATAKKKAQEEALPDVKPRKTRVKSEEIDPTPQIAETLEESLAALTEAGGDLRGWSEELSRLAKLANDSGDVRLPQMVANQAQALMGAYGVTLARGIPMEAFGKLLAGFFRMLILRLPVAMLLLCLSLSVAGCGTPGTIDAQAIQPLTHDVCEVHDQLVQESTTLDDAHKQIYLGNSKVLKLTVDKAASEAEGFDRTE